MKRFFDKLSPPNLRGCRLWMGAVGSDGYGSFRYEGKIVGAHRFAFFLDRGVWPAYTRHECDESLCCEESHLLEGSHQQNMEDCAKRGRNRSPRPGNGYRKISDEKAEAIRARFAAGERNKSALARDHGVTPTRIRQIING